MGLAGPFPGKRLGSIPREVNTFISLLFDFLFYLLRHILLYLAVVTQGIESI